MPLPPGFVATMRDLLGAEWPDLQAALMAQPPVRGVRLHRVGEREAEPSSDAVALAIAAPRLPVPAELAAHLGDRVPWTADGWYLPEDTPLGRHLYHEAGAYYIQEPSAMAAVTGLAPCPGERILDLCAAPGGKATALAAALRGRGQVVANEIHATRVRVLAQNLERLGVPAVVTNETPARLATCWPARFDAVLVDAPCSGEGMFRKDPDACTQWSPAAVEACAARQRDILACAVRLTRPGGRILYCTCTFNPAENEQVIAWALRALPVALLPLPVWPGWMPGRAVWAGGEPTLAHTRRLWPHRGRGEGHFLAALRVAGVGEGRAGEGRAGEGRVGAAPLAGWREWLEGLSAGPVPEAWLHPIEQGGHLFADASCGLPLRGLRVLRPGLCLAVRAQGRWEAHQQLAMALRVGFAANAHELDRDSARRYLAGEALAAAGSRGLVWLHTGGLPLGWGRNVGSRINNLYPKGLRRAVVAAFTPAVGG